MKSIKSAGLMLGLFALVTCGSAWADRGLARGHGHGEGHWHGGPHLGFFVGAPLLWPYYSVPYPYFPYPYSPVIVRQASPPQYIEQGQEQPAPQQYYWYFCSDPRGYYPYVKQCPAGWQPELPHAPPAN